jgi:hypothetical protein
MLREPVPDFFQEEDEVAARLQVQWLEDHVHLGTPFFAKLLRVEEGTFADWRNERGVLAPQMHRHLLDFWRAVLHLLSFVNFDEARARQLLDHVAPANSPPSPLAPPWAGSSLRAHLENHGTAAIDDVERWITSFRFGDPYGTVQREAPCLSTQD